MVYISNATSSSVSIQQTSGPTKVGAEVAAPPKKPEQPPPSPEVLKNSCLGIIATSSHSFNHLSDQMWGPKSKAEADSLKTTQRQDLSRDPEILSKKEQFIDKYGGAIAALKGKDWKKEKANLGDNMQKLQNLPVKGEAPISLEEFRKRMNDFQYEMANLAARKMGISEADNVTFGSKGYDSDIDSILTFKDKKAPEKDKMLFKMLADTVWTHIMGDLSGIQGDIEIYIQHPGLTVDTEKLIEKSEIQEAAYSYIEMGMAILELRRSFGGDTEGWKAESDKLKQKFGEPPELNLAIQQMITNADKLDEHMTSDIIKQALIEKGGDPKTINKLSKEELSKAGKDLTHDDIKRAATLYKSSKLMALSEEMDKDIEKRDKILKNLSSLLANPEGNRSLIEADQKELADLNIRLAHYSLLRNAMFDETYLTQSAYNKTCEAAGGQKDKNKIPLDPSKPHIKRQPATLLQNVFGAIEDFAKYNAKNVKSKEKIHNDTDAMAVAIDGSKYVLRITSSCVAAAKEMLAKAVVLAEASHTRAKMLSRAPEKPETDPERKARLESAQKALSKAQIIEAQAAKLEALIGQAENLEKIATDMEKCKRMAILNDVSFIANLDEAVKKGLINEAQKAAIKDLFKEKALPSETQISEKLSELHKIKPLTKDDKKHIQAIMKARAGFDRMLENDESITRVHEQSKEITMAHHELDTITKIKEHNEKVQKLTESILESAVQLKLVACPKLIDPKTNNPRTLDSLAIWKSLKFEPPAPEVAVAPSASQPNRSAEQRKPRTDGVSYVSEPVKAPSQKAASASQAPKQAPLKKADVPPTQPRYPTEAPLAAKPANPTSNPAFTSTKGRVRSTEKRS